MREGHHGRSGVSVPVQQLYEKRIEFLGVVEKETRDQPRSRIRFRPSINSDPRSNTAQATAGMSDSAQAYDRNLVRIGKERVESVSSTFFALFIQYLFLHLANLEQRVVCCQVSSTDFPGHYPGESHHWDLEQFRSRLKVVINSLSSAAIEFDLVGVDASVANAIRRIVIAEVSSNSRSLLRVECFVQILTFSLVSSLI